MPGDYSRFTFDPKKRFAEVLAQQGRVDLDSDRNELVEMLSRFDQLRSWDTFGDAAVPRATTPDAFRITLDNTDLKIGHGRMYVDGILVEAFEDETPSINKQPFYKKNTDVAKLTGKVLVYADVWQREITHVEDPSLLDSALGGVDTATRTQTVWQVKTKENADCDAKLGDPTDAQMTVTVADPKDPVDPCLLPESGGFTDLENRHYRVELHKLGGNWFVKFARDPIVIEIEKFEKSDATSTTFVVKSVGRDSVLRIRQHDIVEFLNEDRVLHDVAGTVTTVADVKDGERLVTIDAVIDAPAAAAEHRPRLIVWHQKKRPNGDLMIPLDTTNPIELESNISITITGTKFQHGDYWMVPARAAKRTAGPLIDPAPRGIRHHYAPLATITFQPGAKPEIRDCRTIWPPQCDCECEACVNPDDHADGVFTIQMAIDKVKKTGRGGKICLRPGKYPVEKPVELKDADYIWLSGHGNAVIEYSGSEPQVILVEQSSETVVEGLAVTRPKLPQNLEMTGITIRDCLFDVTVRNCTVQLPPLISQSVGIGLGGTTIDVKIVDCIVVANRGVASVARERGDFGTAVLVEIADNVLFTGGVGVNVIVEGIAVTVRDNWIVSFTSGGVWIAGTTDPGFGNLIENNRIACQKTGIGVSADRTTVLGNSVRGQFNAGRDNETPEASDDNASGIVADPLESFEGVIGSVQIIGNRVREVGGCGILIAGRADGAMIKQNFIFETAGGGIVVDEAANRSRLSIENNELRDVALGIDKKRQRGYGIAVAPGCNAAVVENAIDTVGLPPFGKREPPSTYGIFVDLSGTVRVHGNRISGVAASTEHSAGIHVVPPVQTVEVTNNIVEARALSDEQILRHCFTLHVGTLAREFVVLTMFFQNAAGIATDDTWRVLLWHDAVLPLAAFPATRPVLNARTNELSFNGFAPSRLDVSIVRVESPDLHCTFGGNICTAATFLHAGVRIKANTAAVDANQVLGSFEIGLWVDTKRSDGDEEPRWAVIGNIVNNVIVVEPPEPTKMPWPNRLL